MSTKRLEEALARLRLMERRTGEEEFAIVDAAEEELENVRKAAKDMTRIKARIKRLPNLSWSEQEIHDANVADAVMEAIAKEAP